MIYLDHAATTPLDPLVFEAMLPYLRPDGVYANPASSHAAGFRARDAVEHARAQVATLIGAEPSEIIWTSGATESNNLAIKGALEFRGLTNAHIVTARTEHKCVLDTCRYLETQQVRVTYLKPDARGRIAVEQVLAALTPATALVSLMWVNNEIGVIQGIERLAPLLRERGVLFHVDAAQAAGKLAIDLAATPIDLLSLSAHKLYGPKGIGALFVRRRPRARLTPQMHGGGHEWGMRSGTLAPHQIVGMGAAFELAVSRLVEDSGRIAALRERLWQRLQGLPQIHRNGDPLASAPHLLNVSFEGVEGEALRAALPALALSSGSACSSATQEPSYVLRALGRDDELANASLRFSLGRGTTVEHIDIAAAQVIEQVRRLRDLSPSRVLTAHDAADIKQGKDAQCAPDDNAFGYSTPIWQRFLAPARAGRFPTDMPGLVIGEAGTPAARARLRIELRVEADRIVEARFQAYGCPTTIAVGAWLAEQCTATSVEALHLLTAAHLRAALEIPDDRAHCALMGEDALKAAVAGMRSTI